MLLARLLKKWLEERCKKRHKSRSTFFTLGWLSSALNRPFARSDHMLLNKLCWDASYTVGLSKQRKVELDWYKFLCFGIPLRYLRPSIIYSVPCVSDQEERVSFHRRVNLIKRYELTLSWWYIVILIYNATSYRCQTPL